MWKKSSKSNLRTLPNVKVVKKHKWCKWSQPTQTSLRRLQIVLKRSWPLTTKQDVFTTSEKRHQIYDVLKTSYLSHLEDVWFTSSWRRLIYVVLKTSNLRRLEDVWSDLRHLEKVQFATFLKRLIYHVFGTSDLRHLEDVQFTTSWRRCRKRPIYNVLKTSVKRRLCSNVVATSI